MQMRRAEARKRSGLPLHCDTLQLPSDAVLR